ncbi:hypothetical protein L596_024872 [Steinernema carpocapsae]|uniref:Uncharacterized protein n=1 Tax=Steinernema carpocapsae TaxID=34508 RepID=A0A4U5M6X8_STECR|nr:hypothetical protein L596_024872 [Steinernema carpocapsae]
MQEKILAEFHKQMKPIERQLDAAGGRTKVDPRRLFTMLIGSIINSFLVGISYDELGSPEGYGSFSRSRRSGLGPEVFEEANSAFRGLR